MLTALKEQIARLDTGARLPTVRDLMRSHKVSQATVQEALARLRDEGLLTSQVGRGTYVIKGGDKVRALDPARDSHLDSLLILSNASLNERCVLVQNQIVDELSRSGSKIMQMSYHDTGHLLDILTSVPDFDAVILQSHYENIPIRLLRLLQEKTRALVDNLLVLDVTREVAERAGHYRRTIRSQSLELDDCLIAATAFVHRSILATGNGKHYPMRDIEVRVVACG